MGKRGKLLFTTLGGGSCLEKRPSVLPIGFQVVGRIGDDARTLAAAHWLQVNVAAKGRA